ncbi:MAG TPA: methyltransferase domain-containing protein [bacterium]|nr:methyltransferase domain-containing protein [bacterium]
MYSPALLSLIDIISNHLKSIKIEEALPLIINLGASNSTVVEDRLVEHGNIFTADRVDIEDCYIHKEYVGECFKASIEDMKIIPSLRYDIAFANYVFEHIEHIDQALREVQRILKPGGILVLTSPNPRAPEFILSKFSPLWFHQLLRGDKKNRGERAYKTVYAYKNILEFIEKAENIGFILEQVDYFSFTIAYLSRFPLLNIVSKWYDKRINISSWNILKGNICIKFKKNY